MSEELKRLAQLEAIERIIQNTIAAHGDRLVPGSAEVVGKLIKESCLGVDRDHIPGRVAEFIETNPVAKRLVNPEAVAKPESALKMAARVHGVKESSLAEFVAAESAGAAFCETTAQIFDHVARVLDDDTKAEKYLCNPPVDPRIARAQDVLFQFRDHLRGNIVELAKGPFKDIGSMTPGQAYQTVFERITQIPAWYQEYSRTGEPADLEGSQIGPPRKRGFIELAEEFGPEFASRYAGFLRT